MSGAETSSLTEQLRRGFHGLRFEGELEPAWRRDQFRERLRYLRISLAILAASSLAVIQIDRVVVPVIGRIVPDLARVGVMLPLLLAGFAVIFLRRADAWYPRYIAVAMTGALAARRQRAAPARISRYRSRGGRANRARRGTCPRC